MVDKQNEKIEGSLIRRGFHTIRVITANSDRYGGGYS